jgi:FtsH-binding integral membrane protein
MVSVMSLRQGSARLATTTSRVARVARCLSVPVRAFHSTPKTKFFTSRAPQKTTAALLIRNTFARAGRGGPGGARTYMDQQYVAPDRQTPLRRLLVGGAIFGGSLIAVNALFNRETREGAIPPAEREYLNSTFMHVGAGVATIGLAARALVNSGFVYRIMVTNPWVVGIGGLALSFGTMLGTRAIEPENTIPKYALWTAFNATQAALMAPLLVFVPGAILARAGLYTVAMMGGISVIGATAKEDRYLYLGGPLFAGLCLVAASGLAPLVLPATAFRALALSESIWLYGGLAVFGGITLYDVQKIMHHARLAQRGLMKRDPVNEAISLELDFINIFIRMVQVLMLRGERRK